MTIGDVAAGRDNNFNLIRAIAAFAVLVSHAHPIALGAGTEEPLKALTGHSLGSLAVFAFFILSGFLITASYERRKSWADFVAARVLRLMPGLVVSLLLVMFVLGPLVTSLSLGEYLTNTKTWTFLARNTALIQPQYSLPGVFRTNPLPSVEGSIWTLFYEAACYVGVFVAGVIGLLARPKWFTGAALTFIALWVAKSWAEVSIFYQVDQLIRLGVPFVVGMLIWVWRDVIVLRWWIMVGLVGVTALLGPTPLYDLALVSTLAYALFWLGYVPTGRVRAYNQFGDYSYGIYIYAFPVQGLVVWMLGAQTPLTNILWSIPLTVIPAILSWHLIERPALNARHGLAARMRRAT